MYDVIIVGARCAGSSTAMLLARHGHRVLLVDRATFPSDTISGHMIFHRGTVRLKKWGLLDKVIASGCPPITRIESYIENTKLDADMPYVEGAPIAIGPRRTVLDSLLLNAAVEAGVEVREGFSVTELLTDGDRVIGIRGKDKNGAVVSEQAQIVVGADGKHSRIAQLVQAASYMEVPSITAWYLAYWSNLPGQALELHYRQRRLLILFPTNDGLTMGVLAMPHADFHEFRNDVEGNYLQAARMMRALSERISVAKQEGRFAAMADVPNFFRKPYGAGWALVGDAGHHKDPTPAYEISDAFCDAELLTDALHAAFAGEQSFDQALEQYEQLRNQRAIPDHEYTCQRSELDMWGTPEMLGLRTALRGNTEDTHAFFSTIAMTLPREQFFTPHNIGRIMRQAHLMPQ